MEIVRVRGRWLAVVAVAGCLLSACDRQGGGKGGAADYIAEIKAWQAGRAASLLAPDGWVNLAGLFWLEPGRNSAGAAAENAVVFPGSNVPARAGEFVLQDSVVTFVAAPGVEVNHDGRPVSRIIMNDDAHDSVTVLALGSLRWHVIHRGSRFGIRLRDLDNPALKHFKGLEYFPIDPAWRVAAHFEPYDPPKKMAIPTVLGTVLDDPAYGALVFTVAGRTFRLDPTGTPHEKLFVIFADRTNGTETYGGGRFVYVDPPDSAGKTYIDFNKAYNPPCAFTEFATCPLPPRQNKLPIRVTAGEKAYAGPVH